MLGHQQDHGQIHALLIASEKPLSTDEAMEELQISRGNANMNLRELINWGLIRRTSVPGDRKEYFFSESDVWKMFCTIARERKKREIEPIVRSLEECVEMVKDEKSSKEFRDKLNALLGFVKMADKLLGKVAQQEKSKFVNALSKLVN